MSEPISTVDLFADVPRCRSLRSAATADSILADYYAFGARDFNTSTALADMVAEAGLSNDAFYRHFRSKDDLVTAILEDGGERLRDYLDHQLAKEKTPEAKVRRWVAGVLAQADTESAATTLAVLWNGSSADGGPAAGRHFASAPVASLLYEPFATLGSESPELDAALAAHATFGLLSDCVWKRVEPTPAEVEHVTAFCLHAVSR